MPNTQYLEGFHCPKCGSESPFDIAVTIIKRVFDDGSETYGHADEAWCDPSYCKCFKCNLTGIVANFRVRDHVEVRTGITVAPTLFRFRFTQAGAHTHVKVFAGKGTLSLGNCGDLVLRNEEWADFLAELDRRPPGGTIEMFNDNQHQV